MDTKTLNHRRTRRTTLTLEADVANYVEEKLAGNKKLKGKDVINDLIRKGIRIDEQPDTHERPPFEIKPFKTKLAPGVSIEDLEEMMREI